MGDLEGRMVRVRDEESPWFAHSGPVVGICGACVLVEFEAETALRAWGGGPAKTAKVRRWMACTQVEEC